MFGLMQTEIKRCCWGTKEGAVLKTYPQALDTPTYREDSLTSYSFHFMTQTPDHSLFLHPPLRLCQAQKVSPHRPHSSFLHSVTEM